MRRYKPMFVKKVRTAEEAHSESARCLGNANEDRAAGLYKEAERWEEAAQYWLDLRNDLAGDGELRTPRVTATQRDVLVRLAAEPGGRAVVGRGMPFRCNRTTARSLEAAALVSVEGPRFASSEEPYELALTVKGVRVASGLRGAT